MADAVRVVVAGDDVGARTRLRHVLEEGGGTVVQEATIEDDLVEALGEALPDVVVIHIPEPVSDEIATARRAHRRHPDVPLVAVAVSADRTTVLAAIDAGISGYVLEGDDPAQVVAAVRAAAEGGSPLSPKAATALVAARTRPSRGQLTRRERDVLGLLAEGLANREIAQRLGISERTVKAHLTSAFRRIGVRGRTQAALWVRDHQPDVIDLRNGQRPPNIDERRMS
jgi:DNA-binding NarL/FixJ family response regulator